MANRFQRLSLILSLSAMAVGATGCGLSGPAYSIPPLPEGYAGQVTLNCGVTPNGPLTDCRIVNETPAGAGFGEAALAAAQRSRLSSGTVDQFNRDPRVEYTVRFRSLDEIEIPPPAAPEPPR